MKLNSRKYKNNTKYIEYETYPIATRKDLQLLENADVDIDVDEIDSRGDIPLVFGILWVTKTKISRTYIYNALGTRTSKCYSFEWNNNENNNGNPYPFHLKDLLNNNQIAMYGMKKAIQNIMIIEKERINFKNSP